jgi:hypothetical protein
MNTNRVGRSFRRGATIVAVASIAIVASHLAVADIVTGTLKPASAKASLLNAKGEVVATADRQIQSQVRSAESQGAGRARAV